MATRKTNSKAKTTNKGKAKSKANSKAKVNKDTAAKPTEAKAVIKKTKRPSTPRSNKSTKASTLTLDANAKINSYKKVIEVLRKEKQDLANQLNSLNQQVALLRSENSRLQGLVDRFSTMDQLEEMDVNKYVAKDKLKSESFFTRMQWYMGDLSTMQSIAFNTLILLVTATSSWGVYKLTGSFTGEDIYSSSTGLGSFILMTIAQLFSSSKPQKELKQKDSSLDNIAKG